jgi:arabinoxylan arabinofuranohydrolase
MKKCKFLFVFTILLSNLFNFSFQAGESDFNGISLAKGFKDLKNHNPCLTQKFSADPGLLEYNGRVYVYGTNDGSLQANTPAKNEYGQIKSINVMSSADLVNWDDHGTIDVAGSNGVAKWAGNSWAPTACHKKINGKEKFFLYFANNANGIGVLTSDSPTGPWTDPLGKALITRQTPNCNVEWLFDPAVLVDDDGTGYLYFGGGVPSGKEANPNTIRAVKLGDDMISLSGNAVGIDAPWCFEDSGINKVGSTYFYSYCTNWSGGPLGNAKIAYMTSNSPLGPFTYQATCLNNPGDFFGTVGNNHHTIINFKDNFYIFYHAEWLNKQTYGSAIGYRTTHVDVMPFSNGKFGDAKGTLSGVTQLENFDPYKDNRFQTMAWQGGVTVYGLGDTAVAYNRGDWTGISNVDFGTGAKSISINAGSKNGATIRISLDSPSGDVIGYVSIPNTGDNWAYTDVTAEISGASGVKNVFFVASDDVVLNSFKFSQ